MLDVASQQKFTRGCSDAGIGYAQAASAAYMQAANHVFDFWCQALGGIAAGLDASPRSQNPLPVASKAPEVPFGFSPADWVPFPFLDCRRVDAVMSVNQSYNPMGVFMALFSAVPLRGMPAAWPFAQVMINAGVPRDVAWPAAEANAAVIGAAEAATQGFQKVFAACQTGSGFASSQLGMTPTMSTLLSSHPMMSAAAWPRLLN